MKKMKLRLDALAVESFDAGEAAAHPGTVRGHEMIPTPPYLSCVLLTKPTDCPCTP